MGAVFTGASGGALAKSLECASHANGGMTAEDRKKSRRFIGMVRVWGSVHSLRRRTPVARFSPSAFLHLGSGLRRLAAVMGYFVPQSGGPFEFEAFRSSEHIVLP